LTAGFTAPLAGGANDDAATITPATPKMLSQLLRVHATLLIVISNAVREIGSEQSHGDRAY
jgi:hypothetical protein